MSHGMPDTDKIHGGNGHSTNYAYHGTQNRRHTYHTTTFRSSHTHCDQQGCHHIGSPRPSNWFYSTYPHEYCNNVFHTSNTTASNLETPPHTRSTVYQCNFLSSVMIEKTIRGSLGIHRNFLRKKSKF